MTEIEAQNTVTELDRLRRHIQAWRIGTTVFIVGGVIASIASITNAVNGLTQPGPRQQVFAQELSHGLQQKVLPEVQSIAQQTIMETRPLLEKEFARVGQRLPEMTETAVNELQALEQNVTASGEKAVEASLMPLLEKKEQKIRQMFPEATEENIRAAMTTLKEEAQQRAVSVTDTLFDRHTGALNNIVAHMEMIRLSEKPAATDEEAGWEMGLAALDIVRHELQEMAPRDADQTIPGPKRQEQVAAVPTQKEVKQ
jgi:hypothetical protein